MNCEITSNRVPWIPTEWLSDYRKSLTNCTEKKKKEHSFFHCFGSDLCSYTHSIGCDELIYVTRFFLSIVYKYSQLVMLLVQFRLMVNICHKFEFHSSGRYASRNVTFQ